MGFSLLGALPDMLMGKDPKKAMEDALKTAALVGVVGATGGAAAPAAGMGAGATGLTLGGAGAAGMGGGTGLAVGSGAAAGMGGGTGLIAGAGGAGTAASGGGLMASAAPYMQAIGAASQAKGLLSSPQQAAPQVNAQTDGGAGLSQLYASMQQGDAQRMQEEMQKRMKNQGLFGGQNGWTA
jgi:hypothetical protein